MSKSYQESRETRWEVDFRVVSNRPSAYYIQTEINGEWCTLSMMSDNGKNYHFEGYRGFYTLKELLTWYNTTNVKNITSNTVWMPSNALQDIEIVSSKEELINLYPEVII
ncbi:MAG: hypothetical protein DRH57_08280 [Candidatus Cloacimonadota bacterium]|nr:MAG: hypothetical protein DRH57_08280 [Candidatus Cloacimonadota bacterium]